MNLTLLSMRYLKFPYSQWETCRGDGPDHREVETVEDPGPPNIRDVLKGDVPLLHIFRSFGQKRPRY